MGLDWALYGLNMGLVCFGSFCGTLWGLCGSNFGLILVLVFVRFIYGPKWGQEWASFGPGTECRMPAVVLKFEQRICLGFHWPPRK